MEPEYQRESDENLIKAGIRPKPVARLLKEDAILVCDVSYDSERMGCDFFNWRTSWGIPKEKGVYCFAKDIDNKWGLDILKVGKAEGANGFQGRFHQYTSSASGRADEDRTVWFIHNAMQLVEAHYGENCSMQLYILPLEDVRVEKDGHLLEASIIRSYEKALSKQAESEGHSMLLSGQDGKRHSSAYLRRDALLRRNANVNLSIKSNNPLLQFFDDAT